MEVRLSRRAEMDLIEITDFIALDNPERAYEFENELLERFPWRRSATSNGLN